MWYRIVKAQIGGGVIQTPNSDVNALPQNMIPDQLRPELMKILKDLGITEDKYCEMDSAQQK